MATRTTAWPEGTPCWADNHVPDLETARQFYGAMFGWEIDDPDANAGNFACARLDSRPVAGFLVAVPEAQPAWHVYFATSDINATAAAIEREGGKSLFGPQPVSPDRGVFELAADPSGATFGVWQAGSLSGTNVYGEPGSLGWEELHSSDPAAAQEFFHTVFGVRIEPTPKAGDGYATFGLADATSVPLGGIGGFDAAFAEPTESRWVPYFVVDDVESALAVGEATGGRVTMAATSTAFGRTGALADPFEAEFAIVTPNRPASQG